MYKKPFHIVLAILAAACSLIVSFYVSLEITPLLSAQLWFVAGGDIFLLILVALTIFLVVNSQIKTMLSDQKVATKVKIYRWWTPQTKWFKYLVLAIWNTAAALGVIAGILALAYPTISVSQSSSLNHKDPFSVLFVIANNSQLPIESISFDCILNDAQTNTGISFENDGLITDDFLNDLKSGEQASAPCPLRNDIGMPPSTKFTSADITLSYSFKVSFLPVYERRDFRFKLYYDDENNFYWYPQPNSDLE